MANKSSVSVKSSSKTRNRKSVGYLGRTSFLHASNIVIAAVFVLGFAGFGTWYVNSSNASPWYCVQHIYYQYERNTSGGYCVKNIQAQLDDNLWMWNGNSGLGVDGVFGPATRAAVIKYGYHILGYNNNGVVGKNMWISFCNQGKQTGSGDLWYITYGGPSNDGCGKIPTSLYGSSYVGMATVPATGKKYASEAHSEYSFPKTA